MSTGLLLLLAALPSVAQNLIANPGFENNPPPNFGNNYPYSFAPWVLGPGDVSNVVKVDGPGGYNYGSAGPQSDASNNGAGAGAGVQQHYADIVGTNDFYQTFVVPSCGEAPGQQRTVNFSGWFSRRDTDSGSGTITIRQGAGAAGAVLASASASIAASESINTWRQASGTATVTSGSTISFVVTMNNPTNFDEANLSFVSVTCVSAPLTLRKSWVNATVGDAATVSATRGGSQIDSLAAVANSSNEVDVDATPVTVFQAEQITLAEVLATANATAYAASLACTGGGTLAGSVLTVNATGTPIACTYTNTGQSADLSITKSNTYSPAQPSDLPSDTVTSGTSTTYTVVVRNNGGIPVTAAVIRDPAATRAGLTCPAADPVTCAGSVSGVCPAPTTTIGTLESGYTLGTLPIGATATLTFTCTVN